MKSKVNWWKWGVIIAIAAAIFFVGRCNGVKSVMKNEGSDTAITRTKTDTTYIPVPTGDTEFVGVSNTIHVPVYIHDTLEISQAIVKIQHDDTAAILHDYYLTRFYRDTQTLARGKVIISDSVTENRIKIRRLQTFGTDTTITKTIVIKPPQKTIGYLEMETTGSVTNPFYGAGIGLGLKGKNDVIFDVKGWVFREQKPMLSVGVSLPIHLLKKK